jgi:hypothetical protein
MRETDSHHGSQALSQQQEISTQEIVNLNYKLHTRNTTTLNNTKKNIITSNFTTKFWTSYVKLFS